LSSTQVSTRNDKVQNGSLNNIALLYNYGFVAKCF